MSWFAHFQTIYFGRNGKRWCYFIRAVCIGSQLSKIALQHKNNWAHAKNWEKVEEIGLTIGKKWKRLKRKGKEKRKLGRFFVPSDRQSCLYYSLGYRIRPCCDPSFENIGCSKWLMIVWNGMLRSKKPLPEFLTMARGGHTVVLN